MSAAAAAAAAPAARTAPVESGNEATNLSVSNEHSDEHPVPTPGKTTVLLNLVRQLRESGGTGYRTAWLKNEYGEVAVDSRLAAESSISVTEVLNGCVCCTAVGKLGPAIEELLSRYKPARILLETSGSSHPAPLAWELRRLAAQGLPVQLDALICVVDCVNFAGYEDRSVTARLQSKFTDLILLNKHELASEEQMERTLDGVGELNPHTPRIRTSKGYVDQRLLLGLDSALWKHMQREDAVAPSVAHDDTDVAVLDITVAREQPLPWARWETMLAMLPKDSIYRVKGILLLPELQPGDDAKFFPSPADADTIGAVADPAVAHAAGCSCASHSLSSASISGGSGSTSSDIAASYWPYLLNWAFGRHELVPLRSEPYVGPTRITIMGDTDAPRAAGRIAAALQIDASCIKRVQ